MERGSRVIANQHFCYIRFIEPFSSRVAVVFDGVQDEDGLKDRGGVGGGGSGDSTPASTL